MLHLDRNLPQKTVGDGFALYQQKCTGSLMKNCRDQILRGGILLKVYYLLKGDPNVEFISPSLDQKQLVL